MDIACTERCLSAVAGQKLYGSRQVKILLLGKNGQVGWELQRSLAPLGELISLDRAARTAYAAIWLMPSGIAGTVLAVRPDLIVNAAAYTAVDKAEGEPQIARAKSMWKHPLLLAPSRPADRRLACSLLHRLTSLTEAVTGLGRKRSNT